MSRANKEGIVVRHNQKPGGKSSKQKRKEIGIRRRNRGAGAGVDSSDIVHPYEMRRRGRLFVHN